VKKFFALLLCFGLLSGISIGIVGCDSKPAVKVKTEDEKKKEAADKEAADKKAKEDAAKPK
jgi:hypothetical protein